MTEDNKDQTTADVLKQIGQLPFNMDSQQDLQ